MVDITKNFFELFQLPVACDVDLQLLAQRYRELQKAVHPDRFAGDGERQQRLSVQYAAFVNEAFDTLKTPLSRNIYLLRLAGSPVEMEKNTIMDPAFLMEQMELREAVAGLKDDKGPEAELERLMARVERDTDALQAEFNTCYEAGDDKSLAQAEAVVRKMQFMVKLASELEQLESELFDE